MNSPMRGQTSRRNVESCMTRLSAGPDPIKIRFGGYQPERSVHTRAARLLGEALGKTLGDAIAFLLTPQITAAGHQAADLLSLTESGDLEMCYFASSYLAGRVPELGLLDMPFPGTDRARMWRRLDGDVGARIKAAVAARTGYVVLGFWDNGLRHISNGVRAIRYPSDCAGLSIRTLDNRFHQALFSALGFVPRYLDVKDLGPAVKDRTIDAQENPLTNLVNFDLHKTHRHVSLTGHFHGIALLLGNAQAIAGWPVDVREVVMAACAQATAEQRAFAAEEDAQCLSILQADGVEIATPEAIDLAAFKAAVAGVVASETAALDPGLLALWNA